MSQKTNQTQKNALNIVSDNAYNMIEQYEQLQSILYKEKRILIDEQKPENQNRIAEIESVEEAVKTALDATRNMRVKITQYTKQ